MDSLENLIDIFNERIILYHEYYRILTFTIRILFIVQIHTDIIVFVTDGKA